MSTNWQQNVQKYIESRIVKLNNGRYRVVKKDGTGNLGTYDTRKEALDRLQEVEMFKHMEDD